MSFFGAARAALAGQIRLRQTLAATIAVLFVVVFAGLLLSCDTTSIGAAEPSHDAYVSLPGTGNVLLLHIDGATGTIRLGAQTPQVLNASTTGLALLPSRTFLYAINSFADTISIFRVNSDGTLSLTGTPTQDGGSSPFQAVIDPSGKYLLVTNNLSASVSVFSIDANTGALTPTQGSPFFANADPEEILIMPSNNTVYVTNPGIGTVTIFSFDNGVLTQLNGLSPVFSGAGATGMAVDSSGRFLYVANSSAINPPPNSTTNGNISGFNIDPNTGALTPMTGSPFTAIGGSGPTELALSPSGTLLYATTPGSADAIWCFNINATTGQLSAVPGSPFSLPAGATFAVFDPTGGYFFIGNTSGSAIEGYTYNSSDGALTPIPGSPFALGTGPGKMVFSE